MRKIVIQTSVREQAPQQLKIAVNRPSLGFEDVENAEEPEVAQVLTLTEDDVKGEQAIALRYVRFQAVNSLHVRIFLKTL